MDFNFGPMFNGLGDLVKDATPALNISSMMSPIENIGSELGDVMHSGMQGMSQLDIPGAVKRSGSGFLDALKEYAGPAANALGAASMIGQIPLSLMAMNTARQGQNAMEQAINTQREMAAPALAAEQQLYPAGVEGLMTGQLPPQLQTQVNNQVNQYEQQMLEQLTAQGMSPQQARAVISSQVEQMRNQLTMQAAQSLLGGAQSAGSGAHTGGYSEGQLGQGLYGTASNVISNAQNNLSRLLASES